MQSMKIENREVERYPRHFEWYALYTKHQHEKTVVDLLARKGFEVLLPLYLVKHRWKDRVKVVSLPLFPCYVFLRTSLDRKLDILRTPGAFCLVENGGRACPVPDSDIEAMKVISHTPTRIQPHPYLKCGTAVRIRTGVLAGIEGILIRQKNGDRVVLSVDLLQKSVAVEVNLLDLEPLRQLGGAPASPITVKRVA
ncbi:MAG TPA: UpxY family transcription antiterminator [Candidatus Acidoferrum sp.]|nr:UpxY family transcription antiterminator [Candidatus Acidoferrum sp.]